MRHRRKFTFPRSQPSSNSSRDSEISDTRALASVESSWRKTHLESLSLAIITGGKARTTRYYAPDTRSFTSRLRLVPLFLGRARLGARHAVPRFQNFAETSCYTPNNIYKVDGVPLRENKQKTSCYALISYAVTSSSIFNCYLRNTSLLFVYY